MRYIVMPQTMSKLHPLWPNQELFFIHDTISGRTSFSCYTSLSVAEKIVERKNNDQ